ncbi:hypothetical protein VSVS05_04309 (plasmid) [Vibrio scophthalmi]|uniref:Uncharacterized protein n=1 Tax=Vibrio scophthalmi TaxID=45658 RepID=A0A1C7FGY1_9VIBR|nr:hypothetical protein VSVS05_04309 [Vibrio scophthalmi]
MMGIAATAIAYHEGKAQRFLVAVTATSGLQMASRNSRYGARCEGMGTQWTGYVAFFA